MTSGQTLESGQIRGIVYDESRAILPGATVTLTNPATGFTRTSTTGESGAYQFVQIPRGTYEMVLALSGFASTKVSGLVVNVGAALSLDITMKVQSQSETVEVLGSAAIDTSTTGVSQLINAASIENLPLSGRDFRDLAQLSPSAQVVPGLRGGIRLGGQQSDYSGLAIDGGDARDNFFGEFFGSLETKNFTIPLEAVEEFQVVTNGFAPEFGRSTGGLLNVVTKTGTNETRGSAHYFYRGKSLTKDDALGTPSNIDNQHQFGGAIGGPIQKDKQFFFLAFDVQRQSGPLVTKFARDVSGVAAPELGIADLADLEGAHTQFQNLFTVLGKYDIQAGCQRSHQPAGLLHAEQDRRVHRRPRPEPDPGRLRQHRELRELRVQRGAHLEQGPGGRQGLQRTQGLVLRQQASAPAQQHHPRDRDRRHRDLRAALLPPHHG